jgi:hypothetical protein
MTRWCHPARRTARRPDRLANVFDRAEPRSMSMPEGSGIAAAIAAAILFGFVLLPALIAPLLFLFFTVMGMIKGTDFRASTLDLPILLTGVVLIVTGLVALLLVGVGIVGRSLTPRKRSKE